MKKLFFALLTAAVLLTAAAAYAASGYETTVYTGATAITDNVPLRKNPNSGSEILARIPLGDEMAISGALFNNEWHRVYYKGRAGYAERRQLSLTGVPKNAELTASVINCTDRVNVRAAAGPKARIIGTAPRGAVYPLRSASPVSGYYEVLFNGQRGFIQAGYVHVDAVPTSNQEQLVSLTISGGALSPVFSPDTRSYTVRADSDTVTISAEVPEGVPVTINGEETNNYTVEMPEHGVKTLRIRAGSTGFYSLFLTRGVLTVGTFNIKRGNENILGMGQFVSDESPDILGVQEVYIFPAQGHTQASNNLLALRTAHMSEWKFARTVSYNTHGQYGIGLLSAYSLSNTETVYYSRFYGEKRCYQRALLHVDGKEVAVYNTHLSVGSKDAAVSARKAQIQELADAIAADPAAYKIALGDFNAGANALMPLRKQLTALNTLDRTFYSHTGSAISGSRIDNIFVSDNITVYGVRVIDTALSDHRPLMAYITLD